MTDDPPGYVLDQVIGIALHQDWLYEHTNPYDAIEGWFARDGRWPENLEPLIADIDRVLEETPDAAARLALWPHTGLKVAEIDALLRAMRQRAVDGLAGTPRPLRAPEG